MSNPTVLDEMAPGRKALYKKGFRCVRAEMVISA